MSRSSSDDTSNIKCGRQSGQDRGTNMGISKRTFLGEKWQLEPVFANHRAEPVSKEPSDYYDRVPSARVWGNVFNVEIRKLQAGDQYTLKQGSNASV